MSKLLITNARVVNEGVIREQDVLIKGERIERIADHISADADTRILDAQGKYLLPGMIDDQVHFREPGFPNKGTIASESRAAVAGGITSFMEMPNVKPQTTNLEALEQKYGLAKNASLANYSFYLGATNDNIDTIRRLDPTQACGIKVFMGSSTGNMLVDKPEVLEQIFAESPVPIVTHCEDSPTIDENERLWREKYGEDVPMREHARIRSAEACYKSSSMAVGLAKQHDAQLHVLHLTTARELALFEPATTLEALRSKKITAEACVHHLFFNEADYDRLGSQIKCNPSVKTAEDQQALIDAVNSGVIDIIATDHAPHTWEEKQGTYFNAPSGVPLVQHALLSLFELYHDQKISLETLVQKTSHAVAERFQVKDRGYIREGYFADLVLVDTETPYTVSKDNLLYHCRWSPFTGYQFRSTIATTLVNGHLIWHQGRIQSQTVGHRLVFDR